MNLAGTSPSLTRPASWKLALALTLVYLSWGTTYLAIREGVKTLPPGLFGGVRVFLAGLVLLSYLAMRGQIVFPTWRDLGWIWLVGGLMFVGGNGMITVAMKTLSSGLAAVLVATTPLWLALLESLWPKGERLALLGWAGLLLGLMGMVFLCSEKMQNPWTAFGELGPFLVLGSAICWSMGSVIQRHRRVRVHHLMNACCQMLLGGGSMCILALALGEGRALQAEQLTPGAVFSFFYLLVVGSLIGFVAFTWLLGHASAALAGTYAYVNPVVAVLIGWLFAGETITLPVVGGMAIILAGVALVRAGAVRSPRTIDLATSSAQPSTVSKRSRTSTAIMTE
jgi:drug/metabolite transporter (DMT)-like permease